MLVHGKTIVSIIASYKAVKSGYQVAVLAPTMILAKQHFENFQKTLQGFDINIALLVGGERQKSKVLEEIKSGTVDILIGTHAILEDNVEFKNLGFVVTDEQHRFGVKQRSKIISKGTNPDTLVMTATPIPRTLALILYGDLDISIIDELPANRKPIETFAVSKKYDTRVNNFIKKEIDEGRQAYIVCPLVDESENINKYVLYVDPKTGEQYYRLKKNAKKSDEDTIDTLGTSDKNNELKNVLELTKKYKEDIFKQYKVEALHGKMKSKEKDEIMQRFINHEIDILISTTVIEVGIDVKNASIMVIENAERFGLAQLHQLRGRVGRGEYQSYCILKYTHLNDITKQRLEIMTKSNNGFEIAQKDLELRGSGDFFGTKQHGLPNFKIANIVEDMEELKEVQSLALMIINGDNLLEKEENKLLKQQVSEKFNTKEEIVI